MIKYYTKNGQFAQINTFETPFLYNQILNENWQEITEQEFKLATEPKGYTIPIEDDSYTDLSYVYDEPIKEPINDVESPVEEVIEPVKPAEPTAHYF